MKSWTRSKHRTLLAGCGGATCLAGALIVTGCGDEVVKPPVEPVLQGRVETTSGDPVVGARIGIIYHFPVSPQQIVPTPEQDIRSPSPRRERDELQTIPRLINSPNPFELATSLDFPVSASGPVTLTICDHTNVLVRTLVNRLLPAGYHRVVWDARNEAGKRLPPDVYVAKLELGEGSSVQAYQIRMFLWTPDLQYFQEGYLTTTGSDGRFTLALQDLPVGEMVPFWSAGLDSLGSQPVLSTLDVCAVTDNEYASVRVDVLDRQQSVSVTLRIGGTVGTPANIRLHATDTAPPPARTRSPRRGASG